MKINIILNSLRDVSGHIVTVYPENLTARLQENREIKLVNSNNKVIFAVTSSYMYDSAGELSEDIAVELIQQGTGLCFIFTPPDADWLTDESHVYPITIVPQVINGLTQKKVVAHG